MEELLEGQILDGSRGNGIRAENRNGKANRGDAVSGGQVPLSIEECTELVNKIPRLIRTLSDSIDRHGNGKEAKDALADLARAVIAYSGLHQTLEETRKVQEMLTDIAYATRSLISLANRVDTDVHAFQQLATQWKVVETVHLEGRLYPYALRSRGVDKDVTIEGTEADYSMSWIIRLRSYQASIRASIDRYDTSQLAKYMHELDGFVRLAQVAMDNRIAKMSEALSRTSDYTKWDVPGDSGASPKGVAR